MSAASSLHLSLARRLGRRRRRRQSYRQLVSWERARQRTGANGPVHLSRDCVSWVGPRGEPLRSSIAGRRDVLNDTAHRRRVCEFKVSVIVTVGTAVLAAKQATSTIPIVFGIAVDPVGSGLVASLARPGGNVTGLSVQSTDLAGKRLEILRELLPDLHRLAVIADVGYSGSTIEIGEVQTAARKIGLEVDVLEIRRAEDIVPAFGALKSGTQALYVCADALVNANHARINTLALGARLPTIHAFRDFLAAGGSLSYGAFTPDMFRRAGDIVDKILKGAKPADVPVEQPTKFELVINLTTAKALGVTVPPTLLRALTR